MPKPFDLSKFRKELTKSVPGIGLGTRDPTSWVGLGNFAVNWLVTGDFFKGLPLGKVLTLGGEPGSGKSYFAINAVRDALDNGMYVILMDSEQALDETWLRNLGIDPHHERLQQAQVSMIDEVAKIISEFFDMYKTAYAAVPEAERAKFLIVMDSLGMLLTPTDVDQFEKGDMKGDMGRKAKALNALIRNCVNRFGQWDIGMIATNHTYESQDMYSPGQKMSGGQGFMFASSIVLMTKKSSLKEDEAGTKTARQVGIKTMVTQRKSRFNHAGLDRKVGVQIRPNVGMNPYSGLIELLIALEILQKDGSRYKYTDRVGQEHKYYRKEMGREFLDLVMREYDPAARPTIDALSPAGLEEEMSDDDDGEQREQDDS